jgi:hypothetical protein
MASVFNIANADVSAAAGIKASKLEGEHAFSYSATGTIAAATYYLHTVRGANLTLLNFYAAITETVATGADRTVNVDLQKSTGGGAFATVLSATIQFTNGSTARVVSSATISSAACVVGDLLRVVVTVAGAAGAQALGLIATLHVREDPS